MRLTKCDFERIQQNEIEKEIEQVRQIVEFLCLQSCDIASHMPFKIYILFLKIMRYEET